MSLTSSTCARRLSGNKPTFPHDSAFTEGNCDAWTLARVAGHSSISITMRYIHPQGGAIERAFQSLAAQAKSGTSEQREVVTDAGYRQNLLVAEEESEMDVNNSLIKA